MFGGGFGPFRTRDRHCFDEEGFIYKECAKVLELRRANVALRRGRQYLHQISGDGEHFDVPRLIGGHMRSVVPWSRIFNDRELVLAINTDPNDSRTIWVTVDDALHRAGDTLRCLYSTEPNEVGWEIEVVPKNGKAVLLTVPTAGFVVYE